MSADFENSVIKSVTYMVYDLNQEPSSTFVFGAPDRDTLKIKAKDHISIRPNVNVNDFPCVTAIMYYDGSWDVTTHKLHYIIGLIGDEN